MSGHSCKARLIRMAVQCSQTLGLYSTERIQELRGDSYGEESLKSAFWLLYAIEMTDAAYTGRFPTMDDRLTDHVPGDGLPLGDHEWLMRRCLHARICDRLIGDLFSQAALHAPRSEMRRRIEDMHQLLQSWRPALHAHNPAAAQAPRACRCTGPAEKETFLGHHLLVLLVHGKWVQLAQAGLAPEEIECFRRSEGQCLDAARAILEECSQMDHAELLINLRFVSLPKTALCILILTSLSNGHLSQEHDYLRMAYGFYGRLAVFMGVQLSALFDLVDLASRVAEGRSEPLS